MPTLLNKYNIPWLALIIGHCWLHGQRWRLQTHPLNRSHWCVGRAGLQHRHTTAIARPHAAHIRRHMTNLSSTVTSSKTVHRVDRHKIQRRIIKTTPPSAGTTAEANSSRIKRYLQHHEQHPARPAARRAALSGSPSHVLVGWLPHSLSGKCSDAVARTNAIAQKRHFCMQHFDVRLSLAVFTSTKGPTSRELCPFDWHADPLTSPPSINLRVQCEPNTTSLPPQ